MGLLDELVLLEFLASTQGFERSKAPDWGRGPSSIFSLYPSTDSGLTHLRFLHGGLLSFRLQQHYPTTPAQPLFANSCPQLRCQNPSEATPSIQDAVSYDTGLGQPLPLSSFPLSMTPIRPFSARSLSRPSMYGFNAILSAPQCTSISFFSRRRCGRRNRIFPTTRRWGRVHRDPVFRERQLRREMV